MGYVVSQSTMKALEVITNPDSLLVRSESDDEDFDGPGDSHLIRVMKE
jgi:hypothetical protein